MQRSIPVTPAILQSISVVDVFRGRWEAGPKIPEERLSQLAEAARIQSVGSSCRLSGVRLSDFEVAGVLSDPGLTLPGAEEIRRYDAARRHPLPGRRTLLEEQHLMELHAVLAGSETPTPLRSEAGHREAFDADGTATGRVHAVLPPRLVREKFAELVTWIEMETRGGETHPLLTTAVFTMGFLLICPFPRFNGRMSRLVAVKLLERAGYRFLGHAAFEREIEENRERFEEAFDRSTTHFWSGEAKLEPWLELFTDLVARLVDRLGTKLELERDLLEFSPLQQSILHAIWEHGNVDAGLLLRLTGANRNTLKDNLRRLVDRGLLERVGEKRGSRYRLATPD